MANTNSNTLRKWFAAGFFIIVCIGLYWITSGDPLTSIEKQNPNVKIYTDAETPPGGSSAIPLVDSATDTLTDSADSSSSAKIAGGSDSSTISGNMERVLTCEVKDVLGEPIESGTIQFGAQTIAFKQGMAQSKDFPSESFQLTANANGYQSVTQTINIKESSTVDIVMDYTCSFDVQVYGSGSGNPEDSHGAPQAGAEVTLYRAMLCQRPLQPIQRAMVEGYSSEIVSFFDFQYKDNRILILRPDLLNAVMQYSEEPSEYYFEEPRTGDMLLSIGSCQKNNDFVKNVHNTLEGIKKGKPANLHDSILLLHPSASIYARMMDALQLSQKTKSNQNDSAEILLSRVDRHFCTKFLYIPPYRGNEEVVNRAVSDNNGNCRFENLPPGLYFAEARYQNQCSMIRPLLPVSGGVQLQLNSKSLLTVYTQKGDVLSDYTMPSRNIGDVRISLKSTDSNSSGLFMVNTDQRGRGQIQLVPYGTYTLTATPPENLNLPPVQQEITINRPEQTIFVPFNEWKRHAIEGTVVYFDTHKPIPDVRLELYEIRNGQFSAAVTKTDENGAFAFRDIPEGAYQLRYIPSPNEEHKIYPFKEELNVHTERELFFGGESFDNKLQTIFVKSDPVYTTQIMMIGTIATRFSGWVTDARQNPIVDAEIQVVYNSNLFSELGIEIPIKWNEERMPLPQGTVFSDEKGQFDFTVWTRDVPSRKGTKYTGVIKAKAFSPVPQQFIQPYRIGSFQPFPAPRSSGNPMKMTASLKLEFVLGDTLNDLHLIADNQNLLTLEGRIRTEDNRIPEDAKISLTYAHRAEQRSISGEYKPNGEFVISGVENMGFMLNIEKAFCLNPEVPQEFTEYLNETVIFSYDQVDALFEGAKTGNKPKLEFTLKESGFLQGIVQESNRKPIAGARVHIDPGWSNSFTWTDKDGKFRLGQLKKDQKYPLYVTKIRYGNWFQLLSPIQPSVSNIILTWKDEELEEN